MNLQTKFSAILEFFLGPTFPYFSMPWEVLRFGLDRGVPLEPPSPYPFLRVILAEKGTHLQEFFLK